MDLPHPSPADEESWRQSVAVAPVADHCSEQKAGAVHWTKEVAEMAQTGSIVIETAWQSVEVSRNLWAAFAG
jgi:hypothetical protein